MCQNQIVINKYLIFTVLKDVLHDDFSKDSQLNEIIRRSISRDISQEKASTLRRSTRISTMRDSDESSRKVDGISKSLASKALSRKPLGPEYEFGGWLGALIIVIALPLLVLTAHLACTREQCTLSKFHIPRNWHVYFNLEAAEIVLGFVLLQAILSVLPIGRRVSGPPGRNGALVYRCNGNLKILFFFFLRKRKLTNFKMLFSFLRISQCCIDGGAGGWIMVLQVPSDNRL